MNTSPTDEINWDYFPLTHPLKDVEPDVKFKLPKFSSKNNKILVDTSRFSSHTTRARQTSLSENSRKRRNIEEQISSRLVLNSRASDGTTNMENVNPNQLVMNATTNDTTSSNADGGKNLQVAPNRQPPIKRRLLNAEATGSLKSDDSLSSMMPPPSSSAGGQTVTSQMTDVSSDDLQPPLPSPSASPTQSQDEDEVVSGDEDVSSAMKSSSYIRIPTTEEGILNTVEKLIEFLTQRQRDSLTWKMVSLTDRSKLSILNNTIHNSLKRDMISTLPTEITYKILGYLDAKSLIHAEQVSKNWYRIVNRSNDLWKVLIKEEKFITSDEELARELENKQSLIKDWARKDPKLPKTDSASGSDDHYKQIYKKRHIIHQRWMDPHFQPKRTTVRVHGSAVITCLQFDDDKIITGADDNFISVYDTETGNLRKSLEGHTGGVWALKYYKNTLVSGATDRTVRIWNIKQGKCTHVFRGHTSTVRCLDILIPEVVGYSSTGAPIVFPQEPLLITGSRDNTIHVWKLPIAGEDDEEVGEPFDSADSNNPYFVRALRGHSGSVRCISGRGNIVVTGSYDMTVRVWDLFTGRCKLVLRSHTDKVYSAVLDMERKRCISGSMDSTVKIWDLEDGHCIATLEGHASLVGLLELSDSALVSAAADATLRIWDPETGEPRFQLKGHLGAITCFQHDDKKVVSGSEKMLKLWDINTGKFVRELLPEVTGATWQVRFDYRRCISAVQHRHEGAGPDVTLMEILDFGEPYYADETMNDVDEAETSDLDDTCMDQRILPMTYEEDMNVMDGFDGDTF